MAKPIFLIELTIGFGREERDRLQRGLEIKMPNWHVLVANTSVDGVRYMAFSENTATEIEIDELKKQLLAQWPKAST